MAETSRGRAQSEVLGLVLVFAIVVSAVGLVAATGFVGLDDARQAEAANNGVRAFEILADNVEDLVLGRAPDRSTAVKLSNTQLEFGEPVTIEVTGTRIADNETFDYALDVVPIEYDLGDGTRLVYAGGALVREERLGAVMLREPPMLHAERVTVLPILQTRAPDRTSVGGEQTVNVRTQLAKTAVLVAEPEPHRVAITVTSRTPAVWERYFAALPCDTVSVPAVGTVTCDLGEVEQLYVTAVRVDVAFE